MLWCCDVVALRCCGVAVLRVVVLWCCDVELLRCWEIDFVEIGIKLTLF